MQLNEQDAAKVEKYKAEIRELAPKMQALVKFTRPLGKSQVPFNVAQIMEQRYNVYEKRAKYLDGQIRKIYRANGKEFI